MGSTIPWGGVPTYTRPSGEVICAVWMASVCSLLTWRPSPPRTGQAAGTDSSGQPRSACQHWGKKETAEPHCMPSVKVGTGRGCCSPWKENLAWGVSRYHSLVLLASLD